MLREETVEPSTLELLKKIVALPELKNFRLVGGTALSLIYGHRRSIDLDLFIDKPLDKELLLSTIEHNFNYTIINNRSSSILQCIIDNVKVDFVSVKDSFSYSVEMRDDIPFSHIEDLIALKLNAVKGCGAKKDFWDIAKLLEFYTLDDMINFYQNRYHYDDTFAVLRSVIYFDDAEGDADPDSLDKISWSQVKKNIVKAFDSYYKKRIS